MGIKFGCCGSMINPHIDKIGIDIIEDLSKIGYDYIELSLRDIVELSKNGFIKLKKRINDSGIKCEVCNNFFPLDIKLTGMHRNTSELSKYLEISIQRASELGVKVIVLGSPKSKNIPNGFEKEKAWEQMLESVYIINSFIQKENIIVVIEPVNSHESNFITTTEEALRLVKEINLNNIRLLVDYFHFAIEKEDLKIIEISKEFLKHIHFSRTKKRSFPKKISEDRCYTAFIDKIKTINYDNRISIEAYTQNFYKDAVSSLKFFKNIFT